MNSQAMVVLSGGQDSTTCLFWAKEEYETVRAVTFDYGQRHARELDAAAQVAKLARVASYDVIPVGPVLRSRSPLTDPTKPLEKYKDFESMDRIIGNRVELTFVPMRNAFFLTLAANIALSYDCYELVAGVCQQDNANYPDCREIFVQAQERTINLALGLQARTFRIITPLIDMSKAKSIKLAMSMPGCYDALAYSHTCYAGEFPPCGQCHACVLRAHGFEEAGVVDPLVLRGLAEQGEVA